MAHPLRMISLRRLSSFKPNIPSKVREKMGVDLHKSSVSPIGLVRAKIENYFARTLSGEKFPKYRFFDSLSPRVSVEMNFDDLQIAEDHPSRSMSDTFYVDKRSVLRTHTTCHDIPLMKKGLDAFVVFGDCYRKDTIDYCHYPVFHQADAVRLFERSSVTTEEVLEDLKSSLLGLIREIFGDIEYRWAGDYFPFTHSSLELEVKSDGQWLEVLGAGLLVDEVLKKAGRQNKVGWAFGMGLERIAMALYKIPDIRLFHSSDTRFLDQFNGTEPGEFQPFSKFPACYKDVSFWTDTDFKENELFAIVRDIAGDLAESIELIDSFKHPETGRRSRCYRVKYRSFSKNLLNKEVDGIQNEILKELSMLEGVNIR